MATIAPLGELTDRPMTSSSGRKRSVVGRVVELLGDDLPAKLQQQARSFFGLGRSGQDGAVVILQQLEPMLDVARVAVEMRDRQPQLGAQERKSTRLDSSH